MSRHFVFGVFKTPSGASKRARFENAHDYKRRRYVVVRFLDGRPDERSLDEEIFKRGMRYTWRIERLPAEVKS